MPDDEAAWHYGGRYYNVTMASDVLSRDGMGLELEDIGPAPGRGLVIEIFYSDIDGDMTFTSFADAPLPIDLVERSWPSRVDGYRRPDVAEVVAAISSSHEMVG